MEGSQGIGILIIFVIGLTSVILMEIAKIKPVYKKDKLTKSEKGKKELQEEHDKLMKK